MSALILLSTCLKKIGDNTYSFHFRGYLKGEYITKVVVSSQAELKPAEEYLMKLIRVKVDRGELYGEVIQFKKIF